MATLSENINRIKTVLSESVTSLINKGVTATDDVKTVDLDEGILSVPINYPNNSNGTDWTALGGTFETNAFNSYIGNNTQCRACGYTILPIQDMLLAYPTTGDYRFFYSTDDGATWSPYNIGYRVYVSGNIIFANNILIAGGKFYSTDGTTWITSSSFTQADMGNCYSYYRYNRIVYGNGVFLLYNFAYNAPLFYSTDGMTWTASEVLTNNVWNCEYINGKFFSWIYDSTSTTGLRLYYSINGLEWTEISIPEDKIVMINFGFREHKYCNGMYLFITDTGTLVAIKDLDDIAIVSTYDSSDSSSFAISRIVYFNDLWIAITNKGIKYSADLITWYNINLSFATSGYSKIIDCDGKLVLFGNNNPYISSNGMAWHPITSKYINCSLYGGIWDAIYNHGIYIVLTARGSIIYSSNLKTWYAATTKEINAIGIDITNCSFTRIIEYKNKWFACSESDTANITIQSSWCSVPLESIIWAPEETTETTSEEETTTE